MQYAIDPVSSLWPGYLRHLPGWVLLCAGLFLTYSPVWAQSAAVEGRVTDAVTNEPLKGATVTLEAAGSPRTGTATDDTGRFIFDRVPAGQHFLRASHVGYEAFTDTLTLEPGEHKTIDVALAPRSTRLGELVVGGNIEPVTHEGAGFVTISPAALDRIPMPDVGGDLVSYLVTLPGVVTTGDRGGQLFIRGGTPAQNLVLIDGMPVYQPFHIVGFYSAFPAEIVARTDVYAGGFGARYGGRLSSVIDVTTRNGNKERVVGAASIAPFLSSLRLEAPLVPGKLSVVANARESIIERLSPELLGETLPFRFGDRFIKTHAFLNRTSSFSATYLHTFDEEHADVAGEPAVRSRWQNDVVGGQYVYLPTEYPILTRLSLYSSRLENSYRPLNALARNASAQSFNAEIAFSYLFGRDQIDFGISAGANRFEYNLGRRNDPVIESVSEGGGYLDVRLHPFRSLRIEPGIRLSAFSSDIGVATEPRLRAEWRPDGPSGRHRISTAWGVYHQQIVGLYNLADVSEVFIAWAPGPSHERVPRARHFLAGYEYQFKSWLRLIVEGYTKGFDRLIFARYSNEPDTPVLMDRIGGYARGLDLRIELARAPLFLYAGYGLATVVYRQTEAGTSGDPLALPASFSPPHDRRHHVNLIGHLEVGRFNLSARWQLGSGRPFTRIVGFYEAIDRLPPGAGFHTRPGTTRLSYGTPFDARLPVYHRLDVTVERTFELNRFRLTLHAGAVNVYDRKNLFDFDLQTQQRVDQLPFIPSAGIQVEVF